MGSVCAWGFGCLSLASFVVKGSEALIQITKMAASLAILLLALALSPAVFAAECNGKPSPDAKPNLNPILTGAPVFVKSVTNAKLYTVGSGDDIINVVHLWGTPFEMGLAHGTLMKDKASQFMNGVWDYLLVQVEQAINGTFHKLKPWFVDLVAEHGLEAALDLTYDATRRYTGDYFEEEIRGLALATGVSEVIIRNVHMIGELTKGSCSMYGAWGQATASTGSLMQLRALDWDVDGPFKNYPQITVYHPNPNNGHAFANIGWTGWIGSITGFSSVDMAISEIGVSFPDATFGRESRFGIPFTYILRDVLQFDNTLADAHTRMSTAHRTCDLILGVGDGKSKSFRGIQYSASVANFYTDTDMMPVADWHPRMTNVVYYGMDWLCPGYSTVLHAQLQKVYGNITAENTIREVTSITQTGDLHIAIYDLTNMIVHVANARRDGASGPTMAYDRAFTRIDGKQLFAEKKP